MALIFHTADVHLDAPFAFLGTNGHLQRRQVQETFRTLIDRAVEERCDLLLIAGDLFDSNSPSQSTIDFVVAQLGRLAIPVCILPGTHDCFSQRSVYRKVSFSKTCPNVFVFTDGRGEQKEFPHVGVTVHARANLTNQSSSNPLEGLAPSAESRWNIALAHGSVQIRGVVASSDFPIYPEQIARSGMDYIALGHWHAPGNYSQGNVKAYYSGSPEAINFDGSASGSFMRVHLNEDGHVQLTEERVGRRKFASLSIDMEGRQSLEEVGASILAERDPESVLFVTLSGMREVGFAFDVGDLAGELAGEFFHLKIADRSHVKLGNIGTDDFHENTVVGRFVRIMQAKISRSASPEDAKLAEDALQLGVALLQGKEVLG